MRRMNWKGGIATVVAGMLVLAGAATAAAQTAIGAWATQQAELGEARFLQASSDGFVVSVKPLKAGLLPIVEFSGTTPQLFIPVQRLLLRDEVSKEAISWEAAKPLFSEALVANTEVLKGYPSDAVRWVEVSGGYSYAVPNVFDSWVTKWLGSLMALPSTVANTALVESGRSRRYKSAFLLAFADDRLRERLSGGSQIDDAVTIAQGMVSGTSDAKESLTALAVAARGVQVIQGAHKGNQILMDLHKGADKIQKIDRQISVKAHQRLVKRFAKSAQALEILGIALDTISSSMDEYGRTVLLAAAFDDARTQSVIADLLSILESDRAADPAMIAGLKAARDEMSRFSKSRLTRYASILTEAARAGIAAGGKAAVAAKLLKIGSPAALAFSEAVSLHGEAKDLKGPMLASLVTLDYFLLGRIEALVSEGTLNGLHAKDMDMTGLLSFQHKLGYQVIDTLYSALWEGRFGLSLVTLEKAAIFAIKDRLNPGLKQDIENLRSRHFTLVQQDYLLAKHKAALLESMRTIYGEDKSPTSRLVGGGATIIAIVDSSGSMNKTDPRGLRLSALRMIVDSLGGGQRLGLVEFDDKARVLADPAGLGSLDSAERQRLRQSVVAIDAAGGTSIRGALQQAKVLTVDPATTTWVLLTDGMDRGWRGETDGLVPQGVKVHSIAFSSEADRESLARLSRETGGIAETAANADDLHRIVGSLFGAAEGDEVVLVRSGTIRSGEKVVHEVIVEHGQSQTEFRVTWPGSDVDLRLIDPQGHSLDIDEAVRSGFGVEADTYDLIRIEQPLAGTWRAELSGIVVAPAGEPYNFRAAAKQSVVRANWQTNVPVPEVSEPFSITLESAAGVRWRTAEVTTWTPSGTVETRKQTLGGVAAILGGSSGETVYAAALKQAGIYRFQIIANGQNAQGEAIVRSLERSFRVAEAGRGLKRKSGIEPFIRRGVH